MKQIIKVMLVLIAICSSVLAHDFANVNVLMSLDTSNSGDNSTNFVVYSLKHDATQVFCTGICPPPSGNDWYRDQAYDGHTITREDLISLKKTNVGWRRGPDWGGSNQSYWKYDANGNGVADWKELIAGGEPIYWASCGNGWQFYVGGQMLCCNSDTDWENVPYKQMPEAVQTQYPDENHNGIPDIVDAAIAAGGGATSDGGNITVTVENKTINVQVDNTEVLNALQTISNKLNNLNVDNSEVLEAIQTLSTKLDEGQGTGSGGHCDALKLQPYLVTITDNLNEFEGVMVEETRSVKKLLALLASVYYEGIDWRAAGFTGDFPGSDDDDPVLKGGFLGAGGQPIEVKVVSAPDVVTWLKEINASLVFSHGYFQTMVNNQADILSHLRDVQQPTLESIKTNTHNTVQKLQELINILGNSSNQLGGDAFNKEEAHDNTDEMTDAVESKKSQFEEEDRAAEEEKNQLLDHNNASGSSLSNQFKTRLFQLFQVDLDQAKNASQEDDHITVDIDTRPLATHFGKRCGLYARFDLPLNPLTASGDYSSGASSVSDPYSKFRSVLGTLLPILRGVLLFILGWVFISSMLGLLHDAWSY